MRPLRCALALWALSLASPALAAPPLAEGPSVQEPYARATPPAARTGAVYLTLRGGAEADRLIGVESPRAERAEIHATLKSPEGVMRMTGLAEGLPLPAGGTAVLAPGGTHLMLIGLKAPLKAGGKAPLTLIFESGARLEVEAPILSTRDLRKREAAPSAPP